MTIQPSEIRGVHLPGTFFIKGYRKQEVNDYIEAVLFVVNKDPQYLTDGELRQLQNPSFNKVSFRQGYYREYVDNLVEEINEMLLGYMTTSK